MSVDEYTKLIPEKHNLMNIYRVRKVRPNEDDATRVIEVHTLDLTQKPNRYSAIHFEEGWHTLGYISSLSYHKKIQELIDAWEKRRR